ncbi:MAG: glycosyltransferase family 2 protein, partial [bacterium]
MNAEQQQSETSNAPLVSVVIPHLKGIEILRTCLDSLFRSKFTDFEVLLVDNASADGSREMIAAEFPQVQQIRLTENLGYAGGCNVGIRAAHGKYVLLLNDDTILDANAIGELVTAIEKDPQIAGVQPKLLNIKDPTLFDYAGACGGLIDIYGYPFAFGRTFMVLEKDEGQYDEPSDIFWACGTAAL